MSRAARRPDPNTGIERRPVRRFPAQPGADELDDIAVEEPLQMTLTWPGSAQSMAITMRTPGHDAELALGFLFGEGIIDTLTDVVDVSEQAHPLEGQEVEVRLAESPPPERLPAQRNTFMTSSCGVCGKAAIDAVRVQREFAAGLADFELSVSQLLALPAQLMDGQRLFADTGSIHAAALFDAAGELGGLYEDVGRHNAVDKLIGAALRAGTLPLRDSGLLVSGRASFELVQKAAMAGIPMLAAVGAPSSLAIDLAWECDLTLVGFLRNGRCNVYTAPDRVTGLS